MKIYSHYIGVDVSKKTLDIYALQGKEKVLYLRVNNDTKGYKTFATACKKHGIKAEKSLLCLENTGVYGHLLAKLVQENRYNVWMANPIAVKKSLGLVRGKNDKVDARRLALYALRFQDICQLWQPPREVIFTLKQLLATRRRLLTAKQRLEVPLKEVNPLLSKKAQKEIANCNKSPLAGIKKGIKDVDTKIQEEIRKDAQVTRMVKILTSIIGIGDQIARAFIVDTNEFKKVKNAKQLACDAGCAPFGQTSGISFYRKARVSHMANKHLKTTIHMGTLSGIQHCPELREYYERKVKEGKPKLSVINAVKNKQIRRMWACIRDNRMYEKNYTKNLVRS